MDHQKLLIFGGLIGIGLFNLLAAQLLVAARDWWRQFREENFDQPDFSDLGVGRRRRDMTVGDYRFVGIGLIVLGIILWWVSP